MIALLSALALGAELPVPQDVPSPEAVMASVPDRSSPPVTARSDRLEQPEPERYTLGDGVEVWFVPVEGVRRAEVVAVVRHGTYDLAAWPTEPALALGALMDVATERYEADALSEAQDLNEVDLYSWIGHHSGGVSLSVPMENLPAGLALMTEVLRAPAFPKKDLARHLRDKRRYYQVTGPASPSRVASAAMAFAWYPEDHPYGARPDFAAMKKLSASELGTLHARWLARSPITVVVVGDTTWAQVEPTLRPIFADLGAPGTPSPTLDMEPPADSRVLAVDMPGQSQATLQLRLAAPAKDHADRVPFSLLNHAFGGHFLSRLNANLREDKGFTYGCGSNFNAGHQDGTVTVSVDVKVENLAATVTEIEREIGRLVAEGVTSDEIEWAIRADLFDWNDARKTATTARAFYAQRMYDLETVADARARGEAADAVGPDQVKDVAARWLGPDAARVWVVVGDRAQIEPQLHTLGWVAEWTDPASAVAGSFAPAAPREF